MRAILGSMVLLCLLDATVGAAEFTIRNRSGNAPVIVLRGLIRGDDASRFDAALGRLPHRRSTHTTLELQSPGGDARGALLLVRDVLARGVDTSVPEGGTCASACFLVFAAGRHRLAGQGALIGVHGAAENGEDTPRMAVVNEKLANVLRSLHVPERIVDHMLDTPPDQVYPLSVADLDDMGVETTRVTR